MATRRAEHHPSPQREARFVTGKFITLEGIDGAGKSTQAERLAEILRAAGNTVVSVRDPGTTSLAERVREILLDRTVTGVDPMAELMLYLACRAQLVGEVVRPALAAGSVVVSGRYADSSVAYQGYGRELGTDVVRQSNALATGNLQPDLTVLIDIPVDITKHRMKNKIADRLESEERTFHERVRHGFLEIAHDEPERVVVIDGTRTPDEVHAEIVRVVATRFPELMSG